MLTVQSCCARVVACVYTTQLFLLDDFSVDLPSDLDSDLPLELESELELLADSALLESLDLLPVESDPFLFADAFL